MELDPRCEWVTARDKSERGWAEAGAGCAEQPRPGRCRSALQTLEAIAESAGPCQVTEPGNHGEFTRFFAVCIKNVIRHNAMRRPLYQRQQQARRTKERIWLGRGTSLPYIRVRSCASQTQLEGRREKRKILGFTSI